MFCSASVRGHTHEAVLLKGAAFLQAETDFPRLLSINLGTFLFRANRLICISPASFASDVFTLMQIAPKDGFPLASIDAPRL